MTRGAFCSITHMHFIAVYMLQDINKRPGVGGISDWPTGIQEVGEFKEEI